jgi:SH3-like domain-containing protein
MVVGAGLVDVRAEASPTSALNWRAQPGVVANLLRCRESWCEVDIAGRKGWTLRERLWGAEDLSGDE